MFQKGDVETVIVLGITKYTNARIELAEGQPPTSSKNPNITLSKGNAGFVTQTSAVYRIKKLLFSQVWFSEITSYQTTRRALALTTIHF